MEKLENQVFNIDEIDKSIIELIQKEPTLTHTEIAKRVDRSQPTIGMRIRKLEKTGVLKFQAGINIKTMDLILARVEIQTLEPNETIELVKKCPYMLNAFRLSGTFNLSIFVIGTNIADIDEMVNNHFRKNPNITSVYMDIITDVTNDFVLPFDFESCGFSCGLNHDSSDISCKKCYQLPL